MTNPQHTHKADDEFAWLDDLLADLYGYSIGIDNLNSDQKKVKFIDAKTKITAEIKKRERLAWVDELKTCFNNLPDADSSDMWLKTRLKMLTQPTNESEVGDV